VRLTAVLLTLAVVAAVSPARADGGAPKDPTTPPPVTGTTLTLESAPSGASVAIDGSPGGVTPISIPATPGRHDILVTLAGHEPSSRIVLLPAGQTTRVMVPLHAIAPAPPVIAPTPVVIAPQPAAPTPTSRAPSRSYAYVTGGLAIAALGIGTVFGVRALSASSDYDRDPTVDKAVTGESYATVSTVGFIAAAVLVGTTVVIWLSSAGGESNVATGR
jgi:hypothetical protein